MTTTIQRMPLGFGIPPGPRQTPDGDVIIANEVETLSVVLSASVPIAAVAAILPPAFEQAGPRLSVGMHRLRNIGWLGGRGYNILEVRVPATIASAQGVLEGDYVSVLWENRAEPIITGREELGFAKLFAEIDDVCPGPAPNSEVSANASWDGHTFFSLEVGDIVGSRAEATPPRLRFHHKYIPATGNWGSADVTYPVVTPAEDPNQRLVGSWSGTGRFSFTAGTFTQLPTMLHVVNALAAIPLLEFDAARISLTIGGQSLIEQKAIRLASNEGYAGQG